MRVEELKSFYLEQANTAYQKIVELGPFYGKDVKGQNPSFRVSAKPLSLPLSFESTYKQLGLDIYALGGVLPSLPEKFKSLIGEGWSPQVPFLWRVDSIVTEGDEVLVNEVQISDGCDGRMTGLQLAYGLATPEESTPGAVIHYLQEKYKYLLQPPRVVFLRHDISDGPYVTNARRMHEFLLGVSEGKIDFSLTDKTQFTSVDWNGVEGVINYAYLRVPELIKSGIAPAQILCSGDASYIGSKAVFALLHDDRLRSFWQQHLGVDIFRRLQHFFIESTLVKDVSDIRNAKESGFVVKVFNAEHLSALGTSRGVYGPWDLSDDAWNGAYSRLEEGAGLITQKFIKPRKFSVPIRANGGRKVETRDLYNKIAVKYVMASPLSTKVILTGAEATLGEQVKPAGKGCCITSVKFDC